MKVRVYWNLHRRCFSVQDARTRRVIRHADRVILHDVEFVVSEKGRRRVLRERRKNVHAWVVGYLPEWSWHWRGSFPSPHPATFASRVAYNPYRAPTFRYACNGRPILQARRAWLDGGRVFVSR